MWLFVCQVGRRKRGEGGFLARSSANGARGDVIAIRVPSSLQRVQRETMEELFMSEELRPGVCGVDVSGLGYRTYK